jgi:hypothetical protein
MDRRVSRASRISSAAALGLLLALAAGRAEAQTEAQKKEAQALQVAGVHLMERGDNEAALEKFESAFRLFPSPKILFNMGRAHQALGQQVEALTAFERFLDEAPYAPKESRAEATRAVEALRPKLSFLDLDAEDADCKISVDGREVGISPLPRPLAVLPGAHEVRFEKEGMLAETRSVSPVPGQKLRVYVKLSRVPAPATTTAPPPPVVVPAVREPAPKASEPAPSPAPEVVSSPAEPTGAPWQRTAAWVSAGAGVAFLAVGITAQVLASSKNADFNAVTNAPNSPKGQCSQSLPDDGGGPCSGLLSQAKTRQTVAIVGYVASGLALAGALVFYLTIPSHAEAGSATAFACLPSADARGASCALTLRY